MTCSPRLLRRALFAISVMSIALGATAPAIASAAPGSPDEPIDQIGSFRPFGVVSMSDNGRIVVFTSNQTNLGVGGDADYDVFAFDRQTRVLELVSAMPNGSDPAFPSLNATVSGNGRYVVFQSAAPLTVGAPAGTQACRRDLQTDT